MHPALRTIEQEWEKFIEKAAPNIDKDSQQYEDCRQVFYGGFASLMFNIRTIGETEEISEDEGLVYLEERWDELRAFATTQREATKR